MGLYESEISRQMQLRNRQKKEWQALRKKFQNTIPLTSVLPNTIEKHFEEEKKNDDRRELEETAVSKQLASAMMTSSQERSDETLQKVADLLHNQNGINSFIFKKTNSKVFFFLHICICVY